MKELDLIRWIRDHSDASGAVRTGIGDDAAVVETPGGGRIVVTTDMLVEGTHFSPDNPPEDVGRKALAVSVSDIAAMGCRSTAALLAVALRREHVSDFARAMVRGAAALAGEFDLPLAGGDTTETSGPSTICSTVIGEPPEGGEPVLRSGANPGEALFVTGTLGGSLRGGHLSFRPRQDEALALVDRLRPGAMIDLSDGLSTDAGHLAAESGVRILLFPDRIPVAPQASGLDGALHDGEDFELLFTAPAAASEGLESDGLCGTAVTRVGEIAEGSAGVFLVTADGREEPLRAGGYEHFR